MSMTPETFLAQFGHIADSPNGVRKLRELILDLAVRGKLVPQDPNDEPASELLKRIASEKARLVKEGGIKRPNPLPRINSDEYPFDLPTGWELCRLGEVANRIGSGSTPRGGKSAYTNSGTPFLRSQNIWNYGLELRDVAYIPEETHKKMANTAVYPNDILLNITGASLGRCAIYPDGGGEANVSQHVTIIRPTDPSTRRYLHLCILSPYTQSLVWGRQVGMAREGLSKKVLELFEVPLPPLEEQKRIVSKVDQLMALCDRLEEQQKARVGIRGKANASALDALVNSADSDAFDANWRCIATHFDRLIDSTETLKRLRATILDLAVRGKLISSRNGWKEVNLGDCIELVSGQHLKPGEFFEEKVGLPYITGPADFGEAHPIPSRWTNCTRAVAKEGDVLLTVKGAGIGKLNVADTDTAISRQLMAIRPKCIDPSFIKIILETAAMKFRALQVGIAIPGISRKDVLNLELSLPPLEEQKRIVSKVDQLMAVCDLMEAQLAAREAVGEKLAASFTHHLLAA